MTLFQPLASSNIIGLAFIIGLVLFSTITALLHLWERNQWAKQENALFRELHGMRDSIRKEQKTGFAFFEIDDEYKPLFQDAMNGFQEYARLKGYKITLATDVTITSKIGIKIILRESDESISTESVHNDVQEYLLKLEDGDDFQTMPIVTNPIEHQQLIAALKMRFSFLKHEIELRTAAADAYRHMLTSVMEFAQGATPRNEPSAVTQNITLHVEGATAKRDNLNVTHSPSAILGKDVKIKRSTITSDTSVEERDQQAAAVAELIVLLKTSVLRKREREIAVRDLENIKEELSDEAKPDRDRIDKWLGRVMTIVKTATASTELLEKARHVFSLFGMSL